MGIVGKVGKLIVGKGLQLPLYHKPEKTQLSGFDGKCTRYCDRQPLYSPRGAPYLTQKKLISGRENICQEWGCKRGLRANLMHVYIA